MSRQILEFIHSLIFLRNRHRRRADCCSPLVAVAGLECALEQRQLLTAVIMSDQEQLLLELVNRARANPVAEAQRFSIGLNDGLAAGTITTDPKQPLAPNQILTNIAAAHSLDMLNRDYFSHTTLGTTNGAPERAVAAGYGTTAVGENIAWGGDTGPVNQNQQVLDRYASLFRSPGHRQNTLHPPYEEAGMGIEYGVFTADNVNYNAGMVTENFGIRHVNPYITGVVYTDSNNNNFYDIGESIRSGNITVTNNSTGAAFTDNIGVSGSYGIIVPAGTYTVAATFRIGTTDYRSTSTVTVAAVNVKQDFRSGSATAVSIGLTAQSTTINESGAGSSTTITVTRTGGTSGTLVLNLSSSDTTEATVPSTVTFPDGQSTVTFTVSAVNDSIIDGNQLSTITIAALGYSSKTVDIIVSDRTAPGLPATLLASVNPRPLITWTGVSNAATYEIWISNDSLGAGRFLNIGGLTGTSFVPLSDLPFGYYRIWIRGITSGSVPGNWSLPQNMRVLTPPVVSGHGVVQTSSNFVLNWTSVPGAVSYDVWIDRLTSSTSQYFRSTSVTGTSVALTDFSVGRYAVWVRARNSGGHYSNWSSQITFTVSLKPETISVSGSSLTGMPTLDWNDVPGASQYDVWVNSLASGNNLYLRDTNVSESVLPFPETPAPGSYRVWIRARDVQGSNYAWSTPFDFEFNRASQIRGPVGPGQSDTPLFQWTPVSGAVRYELWTSRLDGGTERVIHLEDLTTTTFVPTIQLSAGSYRVWIRAFDAAGSSSAWSASADFSVAGDVDQSELFSDPGLLLASILKENSHQFPPGNTQLLPSRMRFREDRATHETEVRKTENHSFKSFDDSDDELLTAMGAGDAVPWPHAADSAIPLRPEHGRQI